MCSDKPDEDYSLETSEALSRDGEQEVPFNKKLNKDPLRDMGDKHKGSSQTFYSFSSVVYTYFLVLETK